MFGKGKKESRQGYTPPPMPVVASDEAPSNPEELWLSDNASSPSARAPPASSSTPGGSLGLDGWSGSGRGSMVVARLEEDFRHQQERIREQREREQIEAAIRISQEMAQQEEATRTAAAVASAAAAAEASSLQPPPPSAPATPGQGLFSGLSLGSSAASPQVSQTGIYGQSAAISAFSFVHDGSGAASGHLSTPTPSYASDAPVEASAFTFMQSSGVAPPAESSAPQRVGDEGSSKQTIEPIEEAREPFSQVYLNMSCNTYLSIIKHPHLAFGLHEAPTLSHKQIPTLSSRNAIQYQRLTTNHSMNPFSPRRWEPLAEE